MKTFAIELAWVALVPAGLALAVMLLGRRFPWRPRAAWAAGVGAGFVAGSVVLAGRHNALFALRSLVRPHEARDWLSLAVLLAAGISIFAAYAPRPWQRWAAVLAAVLAAGVPMRLLAGSVYVLFDWSAGQKLLYLVLLAGGMAALWTSLSTARDTGDQPAARAALLLVVACGAACALALSGALVYGQLAGAVAAALAGATCGALARWPWPRGPLVAPGGGYLGGVAGAGGVLTMSLGGVILLGYFYAKLAGVDALLLAIALMAAGAPLPPALATGRGWTAAGVRSLVCLVPLALAVYRSYAATVSDGTGGSPYAI